MAEGLVYPKILNRPDLEALGVNIGGMDGEVEYTSDWEPVEGGKGVTCRTWKLKGVDVDVDGADIIIEAGGYSPVQMVNEANVVVDSPEGDEVYCVVMDENNKFRSILFDKGKRDQMVLKPNVFITWIAKTSVRLTEFESPSFSDKMFINVPEGVNEFNGRPLEGYMKEVKRLRKAVEK